MQRVTKFSGVRSDLWNIIPVSQRPVDTHASALRVFVRFRFRFGRSRRGVESSRVRAQYFLSGIAFYGTHESVLCVRQECGELCNPLLAQRPAENCVEPPQRFFSIFPLRSVTFRRAHDFERVERYFELHCFRSFIWIMKCEMFDQSSTRTILDCKLSNVSSAFYANDHVNDETWSIRWISTLHFSKLRAS